MIDVSDGLSLDLHRLADASGVGFVLDAVPVAPGATLDEALGGGEDYELVVATSPSPRRGWRRPSPTPGCAPRWPSGGAPMTPPCAGSRWEPRGPGRAGSTA